MHVSMHTFIHVHMGVHMCMHMLISNTHHCAYKYLSLYTNIYLHTRICANRKFNWTMHMYMYIYRIWDGMIWFDMIWYYMIWYGYVCIYMYTRIPAFIFYMNTCDFNGNNKCQHKSTYKACTCIWCNRRGNSTILPLHRPTGCRTTTYRIEKDEEKTTLHLRNRWAMNQNGCGDCDPSLPRVGRSPSTLEGHHRSVEDLQSHETHHIWKHWSSRAVPQTRF